MAIVKTVVKPGSPRRTIGLPVKPTPKLSIEVDVAQRRLDYGSDAARLASEFHANLFGDDQDDEFGDVDNELEGLTIVETAGVIPMRTYLRGYGVL